ncbi:hypothetical protein A8F94_14375 [Bacillus sp. FJAT-27225]|uniref:DUF5677 domain-containing protein n=1 Tax=Bacillus sp. FJAT-27225 TaxID=1743144 RepID=UPI00080C2A67|nr:DUF5677 domain-containing protein [Bacillus sp. FJAT-27225]OCA86026.1 hypothetical protein A8F94_14375 [Bacillus sp. FJAT-27225]
MFQSIFNKDIKILSAITVQDEEKLDNFYNSIYNNLFGIGVTHNFEKEDRYFVEALSHFMKQIHLLRSAMILLKNNLPLEAGILVRSATNIFFVIEYLLQDGKEKENFKKLFILSVVAELFDLKSEVTLLEEIRDEEKYKRLFNEYIFNDYQQELNELRESLKENYPIDAPTTDDKFDNKISAKIKKELKLPSIKDMASVSVEGQFIYNKMYNIFSIYDHSSPRVLHYYRELYKTSNKYKVKFYEYSQEKTDEQLFIFASFLELLCLGLKRILEKIQKSDSLLKRYRNKKFNSLVDSLNHLSDFRDAFASKVNPLFEKQPRERNE